MRTSTPARSQRLPNKPNPISGHRPSSLGRSGPACHPSSRHCATRETAEQTQSHFRTPRSSPAGQLPSSGEWDRVACLCENRLVSYLDLRKQEITAELPNTRIHAIDAGPVSLGRRLESEKTPGAYSRLVYAKGAYALHTLRMLLRSHARRDDGRFIAMMRDFTEAWGGRAAATDDFQAVVSKHFGTDMSWFFNQWIHGTQLPRITVQYRVTPADGGAVLEGTIAQAGVSAGYRTMMPVVRGAGDRLVSGIVTATGETSHFSIRLPMLPDRVEFNPLRAVLCDLEVKKL